MKKLVVFLVLTNIALFLWQMRSQSNSSQEATVPVGIPSLQLLSESSSVVEVAQEPLQQMPKPTEMQPVTVLPSDTSLPVTSTAIPTSTSADTEVTSTPAPTLTPTTQTIEPVEPTPSADSAAVSTQAQSLPSCLQLLGFSDQASGEKAAALLIQHKITAQLEAIEKQVAGEFLVYLKPFENRDAALIKLRELKAKSIDSFVIADGDKVNGISLGVFSKEESAKKLQAQLKEQGYAALLDRTMKTTHQYAIRVVSDSALLGEDLLSEISKKYANDRLVKTEQPCP